MVATSLGTDDIAIAFIGFGEAASAFVEGWGADRTLPVNVSDVKAYDIKTDHPSASVRGAKRSDYARSGVVGCSTLAEALSGANVVFSTVTPDQALVAANSAVSGISPNALYADCNSCAPDTKRSAAELIDGAGGRYVDVAVMAPVHPGLHRAPLLLSGDHAADAQDMLGRLGMTAKVAPGAVGASSSVKMIRSSMIKGLEALMTECVLAGREARVEQTVLDSLETTFPGFRWSERAAYALERVITHGVRRAAEMHEVASTIEQLGLEADMAHATAKWQQRVGELKLEGDSGDYRKLADAILERLKSR